MRIHAALGYLAAIHTVSAVNSLVQLDYATYSGTPLRNGITQWLGVRYAAPPVGDFRFAAPQDPLQELSIRPATTHGPTCLGTNAGSPSDTSSEDCLFLDVYAPSEAISEKLLPVYFFIQGGGFNSNSNPNLNGSGLIAASGGQIVVVNLNYRVGPYGFLAGEKVAQNGTINAGLKDQRKALQWVQRHISQFGGNPKHVVLGGDSAGAQSVTLHVTAYGGRNDNLFHAVAAESQSFSALRTISESEFAYDSLVRRANCTRAPDTLTCLRNLTPTELQAININSPFPGAQHSPLYMYGPTLDNDIVSDYTYRAYAQGKFIPVPAIYGDDTNEGTIFTPQGTASYADSDVFLHDQFPFLTPAQTQRINALYPVGPTPSFPGKGRFWRQVSDAYGEMRYVCPGLFLAQAYANRSLPAWNYRWNVLDPAAQAQGFGVTHTVEVNAIWGPENVRGGAPASYLSGGSNAGIVAVVQGYWTSFIRALDPNVYRVAGTPRWEAFAKGSGFDRRLMFQTGKTGMEEVDPGQLERCEFLWSIALANRQ